ncbi:Vacuolar protein-sorting-associated protein 36 [Polyrhizophydium stewartii]|uniref:Vacuolar protein-sorting-associated protein 36 n=1 Tax=Polyrhizophydium stewartii TaxID=2732419 RepID=A0ABR4NFM6_9FUNG
MEWLEPLDLTVGRRPVLLDGEVVACTSSEVGLYLGSERIAELDSGTLYVTSHRLLWVDEPKNHAVQLRLALVLDAESAGRFLRSSPKITLRLLDPDAAAAQLEAVSGVPSALQQAIVSGASAAALRMTLPDWVCEICDNTNSGEDAKCALCGVPNSNPVVQAGSPPPPAPQQPASHPQSVLPPSSAGDALSYPSLPEISAGEWICEICEASNPDSLAKCALCGVPNSNPVPRRPPPPLPPIPAELGVPAKPSPMQVACPVCTFLNHVEMVECEMCGASLSQPPQQPASPPPAAPTQGLAVPTVGPARVSTPAATAKSPILKLSFRGGGMTEAFKQLRQALDAKAWEIQKKLQLQQQQQQQQQTASALSAVHAGSQARAVGVAGIVRNVEETQKRMGASVDDAFSDLTSLMDKASEMVRLAESISARLAASGTHSDSPEMVLFRNYLAELGISNPVTKETAGDLYAQELARQLADFLDRMLKARQGDMVPLTDLYCLFNRARGVALVSPEDIYRSASEFERLRLPFRLRKFDSGLLVVQSDILLFSISHSDDAVAAHILEALADVQTGLTAVALAKRDGISVLLATEQLLMTERSGLTCRDDTVEGLFFYPNRFVD